VPEAVYLPGKRTALQAVYPYLLSQPSLLLQELRYFCFLQSSFLLSGEQLGRFNRVPGVIAFAWIPFIQITVQPAFPVTIHEERLAGFLNLVFGIPLLRYHVLAGLTDSRQYLMVHHCQQVKG
jgi:hypothetical protein